MWAWTKSASRSDGNATSIIDQGCEFSGRLTFVGTLILNGKFEGELVSADTLVVGEMGELQANVHVGTAILRGQFQGKITANERLELHDSARVIGDLVAPVVVLEEGVLFDGTCKMNGQGSQESGGLRVVGGNLQKHQRG